MRQKLRLLADGTIAPEALRGLVELQERAVEQAAKADRLLTPMEVADREDALSDRLDELGVEGGFDLAPVFVAAGLDVAWLDDIAARVDAPLLGGAVRWLRTRSRPRP
jgi:hypothetical protein